MEPIRKVRGKVLPLNRADVDTDQIIPAKYLKRIERTGFGEFAFDARFGIGGHGTGGGSGGRAVHNPRRSNVAPTFVR